MTSDERGWIAPPPPAQTVSSTAFRRASEELRLFCWVVSRPKESEPDSLQIAFHVGDTADGSQLLAALGLEDCFAVQRSGTGPFAGAVVQAFTTRAPLDEHGDPRWTEVVAKVQLCPKNPRHEVTSDLIDQAREIEDRLASMGADRWPRETGLLSWITRTRYPQLYTD